ncbi:MAG: hypothetical protein QNL93_05445 [Opitutae bacterium]
MKQYNSWVAAAPVLPGSLRVGGWVDQFRVPTPATGWIDPVVMWRSQTGAPRFRQRLLSFLYSSSFLFAFLYFSTTALYSGFAFIPYGRS